MTTPRRNVLRMIAATPFIAGGVKTASEISTLEGFLAKATPEQKAKYHSDQLVEAMKELNPGYAGWRSTIDHENAFVLITPGHGHG